MTVRTRPKLESKVTKVTVTAAWRRDNVQPVAADKEKDGIGINQTSLTDCDPDQTSLTLTPSHHPPRLRPNTLREKLKQTVNLSVVTLAFIFSTMIHMDKVSLTVISNDLLLMYHN